MSTAETPTRLGISGKHCVAQAWERSRWLLALHFETANGQNLQLVRGVKLDSGEFTHATVLFFSGCQTSD
jgi:hypothetical protein